VPYVDSCLLGQATMWSTRALYAYLICGASASSTILAISLPGIVYSFTRSRAASVMIELLTFGSCSVSVVVPPPPPPVYVVRPFTGASEGDNKCGVYPFEIYMYPPSVTAGLKKNDVQCCQQRTIVKQLRVRHYVTNVMPLA